MKNVLLIGLLFGLASIAAKADNYSGRTRFCLVTEEGLRMCTYPNLATCEMAADVYDGYCVEE